MDIFFEQAQKEIDLLYLEAVDELKREEDLSLISFMESGDIRKKKSSEGIFAKIKKMIENTIEKIKAFFTKKQTEENTKKLQEAIKKDPSLKNKKVQVKDYEKIIKLNKATLKKLENVKTQEEADKIVADYMKKKNAIIAAGAVVTVSVAGVLGFMLHGKNKLVKQLDSDLERANNLNKEHLEIIEKHRRLIEAQSKYEKNIESYNKFLDGNLKSSEEKRKQAEQQAEYYKNLHKKAADSIIKRDVEIKELKGKYNKERSVREGFESDNKKLREENKALAQSKIIADNCKILMEYTKEYGVVGLKKAMIAFDKWYNDGVSDYEATKDMRGTKRQKIKALYALEDIDY